MEEHDSRLEARPGADGPSDSGRIRRPDHRDDTRVERLSAYLDGWVTDRERSEVEREMAGDAAAREALHDLRLVRTALSNLETVRAPRSFALTAPPARRPFALFRRLEWATRGAAGLTALAFAFALVNGPQVSETITTAMPAAPVALQSAPAPVEAGPTSASTAKARETATQTLDIAPGGAVPGTAGSTNDTRAGAVATAAAPAGTPSTAATATSPAAPVPTVAPAAAPATTFAAPTPASAPASTPVASPAPGTSAPPAPAPAPRTLQASPPTATPIVPAASADSTPVSTVQATRVTSEAGAAAPVSTPTPAAVVPTTPAPSTTASAVTGGSQDAAMPAPGTLTPVSASENAKTASVAPALGVLALLLVLLAIIERAGARAARA
ncbi:MAG: hypothetical protein EPO65_13560 [Dehalococcoidia bacterium]|nr:MAG: hypothetical protein EPO65_13560 [Dehalococcoidia bacterium]